MTLILILVALVAAVIAAVWLLGGGAPRTLIVHRHGKPFSIVGRARHWAARFIGRSFTIHRWHFYKWAWGDIRRRTFAHELGHTGDVQEAIERTSPWLRWLIVPLWLVGYFGKQLLRRLCHAIGKPQWAPRDLHENHARAGELPIVQGVDPEWTVPDAAWKLLEEP